MATALVSGCGGDDQSPLEGETPIEHVVIIYQENHTFDNVLGPLCIRDERCDGAAEGQLLDGSTIPIRRAADVVPDVNHEVSGQLSAINDGAMNGFEQLHGCEPRNDYACYTAFAPSQIPNLASLARHYTISDRTFSMDSVPTWGSHLELVAQTLDGFYGDHGNPGRLGTLGPGWGCDSGYDAPWRPSPEADQIQVPACIPDPTLDPEQYPYGGAYRRTPVEHVPTIMDRLDDAGLDWRLYAAVGDGSIPYGWAICPTFADCVYTEQRQNQVDPNAVLTDAREGQLPAFSIVLPYAATSQHNDFSMLLGDNWIGDVVDAIAEGPDWDSTAIFITYDDCGCFYDHVPPPDNLGIRVPMVIVSPYAKPGYTDSNTASFSSMLAFTEHVLDLAPLTDRDAEAYDYAESFDFGQEPLAPVAMERHTIPPARQAYIEAHPADPNDPT